MKKLLFTSLYIFLCVICSLSATAQKELNHYFVFLNPNPEAPKLNKEEAAELQKAHLAAGGTLYKEGKLIASGPFSGGGGMHILRAESLQEAQSFLQTDPAVRAERFNLEVLPLETIQGSLCKTEAPYEMVTYSFVLFKLDNKLSTAKEAVTSSILDFLKNNDLTDKVMFNCNLGNTRAFILNIDQTEAGLALKNNSYAIQKPDQVSIKQLWIAKGTFCEDR